MSVVTLVRPNTYVNSFLSNWSDWLVDTGSGTLIARLTDNSDTSRAKQVVNGLGLHDRTFGGFQISGFTVPPGSYIDKVRYSVRYDIQYISNGLTATLNGHITKLGYAGPFAGLSNIAASCTVANVGTTSPITTFTSGWIPRNGDNKLWVPSDLTTDYAYWLSASPTSGAGDLQFRIYDVWLEISTNTFPSVSISPLGTLTNTTAPLFTFTNTDADGDAIDRLDFKIFSLAQYTAPTFSPTTSGSWYSESRALSVAAGGQFTVRTDNANLFNSTSYRIYYRIRQQKDQIQLDWQWAAFSIQLDAPVAPTLTVTPSNSDASMQFTVTSKDNILLAETSSAEGSSTLGWAAGANTTFSSAASGLSMNGTRLFQLIRGTGTGTASIVSALANAPVVAPSTQYTAMAWFRANTVTRSCRIIMTWYDASGAVISTVTGSSVTNTTGGWTQATAQGTSPSNAAKVGLELDILACASGEFQFIDQIGVFPGNTSSWSLGGYADGSTVFVQYSLDGGINWQPIRNGSFVGWPTPARSATLKWYEAPPGQLVSYRAFVEGTYVGATVIGAITDTINATSNPTAGNGWWLIDPLNPTSNMLINIMNESWKQNRNREQAVYKVMGRSDPVVVSDVVRLRKGSFDIEFLGNAAYNSFEDMWETNNILLLKRIYSDVAEQMYIMFGQDLNKEEQNYSPTYIIASVDFNEVLAP
jgi:hypothetical protein